MAIEISTSAPATGPAGAAAPAKSAADGASRGGRVLPSGGNGLPVRAEPVPPVPVDISRAITNLNRFLEDSQRDFLFRLDQASGRTVITIVNPSTGEIVRQIPPEEVLNAARTLREAGLLLSARA